MRKYKEEEITFLQQQTHIIQTNATEVIIKASPTEHRAGCLDPHQMMIIKQRKQDSQKVQPPKEHTTQDEIRAVRENMGFPNLNLNTEEIHTKYESLVINGNQVGLWRYFASKVSQTPLKPCMLFIHGGGWVAGSTQVVENPCKLIAELAGAVVFNIEYSLAPEKKFPHGFNDCYETLLHIHEHAADYGIDPQKIVIAGDSAGGNLAAAVAMKARDMGCHIIALQILIYPCVTFISTGIPGYVFNIKDFDMHEEQRSMIEGMLSIGRPVGEHDHGIKTSAQYLNTQEAAYHPYVSPMLAHVHTNLPPALCVSAEFDGLRIQTEHYAGLLKKSGVQATAICYKGVAHAFLNKLGYLPQAEDLCIEIANRLKQL